MGTKRNRFFWSLVAALALMVLCAAGALAAEGAGQVDINQATVEEMTELEGVGPGYAQKIVEYREQNGPFDKPEDIMKVKGIGQRIWDANKDRIKTK